MQLTKVSSLLHDAQQKIFLFLAFSVCELTNNKHVTKQHIWEVHDVQNCLSVKTAYDVYIYVSIIYM